MRGDTRIQQLFEELVEAQTSPEDVCRDCPELLPELRHRWKKFCQVRAELDAIFPSPSSDSTFLELQAMGMALPEIAGYQVEELLGRGGMGVVFRARQLRLNRVIALKMILTGAFAGPQERERFQREAEAAAALRHPNVVQIYDIGESDGRPYFTMEYLEGGNLAQKLAGKPQPARQAAATVATLAQAVQAAHQLAIVHRDLKPSNVLLAAGDTPKISDFGLARRLDRGSEITWTGTAIGTPGYMAPEQARSNAGEVQTSADIYALGAILYEMLTGRPPFHGETAAETVVQVIYHEPVPPSHVNPKIPRDLETICLKCLQKKPQLRYVTAGALEEDLERFLRGEAIEARPIGTSERLFRWIRHNPTGTALIFTVMALLVLAIGTGMREWAASSERQAELQKSAIRLDQVIWLQQEGRIPEARELLGGVSSTGTLQARIERAQSDLDLAERLDAIRLGRATRLGERLAFQRSAEDYEMAFREAKLGSRQEAAEAVAGRIRKSNIQLAIVAALDDWTACTADLDCQKWVLDVVRLADHDPTGWRDTARNSVTWKSKVSMTEVTAKAPVDSQSVPLLLALAEHLKSAGGDPIPFLMRVQQAHPSDFWTNLRLGEALMETNNVSEAIRFYQAAVGLRPQASVVYDHLGLSLAMLGRMEEADEQFRLALRINPTAPVHNNLGITVATTRRIDESIDDSKAPHHFGKQVASLHVTLGDNLRDKGKLVEAGDRYRRAIAIDPRYTSAQLGLRRVLTEQGSLEEVREVWRTAIHANPPDFDAWDGYAELCLFFGDETEYRRIRTALLERFASTTNPRHAECAGRACLLLAGSTKEVEAAGSLIESALNSDPDEPYYLFAKGLLEYRRGRLDAAIRLMNGPAGTRMSPAPQLIKAMAQFPQDKRLEASKTLSAAIVSSNWRSNADNRDTWIFHILRREAEILILPNLRALLDGNYQPTDNDERLALVEGCRSMNCPRAAARLYMDAFAADPRLQDDLDLDLRYHAARTAALAGCGMGQDAKDSGDRERESLRDQAREWLRADLTAWERALSDGDMTGERVGRSISPWRSEHDFAGLRDSEALRTLPVEERTACETLWRDLGRVLHWAEHP